MKNLFKTALLALSIFVAAGAVYFKIPAAREWVDTRYPQLKPQVDRVITQWNGESPPAPTETAAPASSPTAVTPPVASADVEKTHSTDIPNADVVSSAPASPAASAPVPAVDTNVAPVIPQVSSESIDLTQMSQSRAEWPKSVSLKKAIEFPAVLDGRVVGHVTLPAGAQAHLLLIKDSKLGLEYQGGGAMVSPEDTDFAERVLAKRQASIR